jgi:glycosyltransferase involved in cell wall biosynthesis
MTKGGVLYKPENIDSLVNKWCEVLSNPENINKMSINGIKAVAENFTNEVLSQKVLKIYEKVTEKKEKSEE